jgi:hypothetical protein
MDKENVMYSKEEIIKARETAKLYNLKMCREFWFSPVEYLQKHCNGVGSEAMFEFVVEALNAYYRDYQVCAMEHDLDYLLKRISKEEADKRFYDNMLIIWKKKFGWKRFLPCGLRDFFRIRAAYIVVRDFGQSAWENASVDKDCKSNNGV